MATGYATTACAHGLPWEMACPLCGRQQNQPEISQPYARELARQVDELEAENAKMRDEIERMRAELDALRETANLMARQNSDLRIQLYRE